MKYTKRVSWCDNSDVADIFKVLSNPEILSMAGGMPAPELFPIEELKAVTMDVFDEEGEKALQYSSAQGDPRLRAIVASRMNKKFKTSVGADDVLITNGSQQALDMAGKIFIEEGSIVLCESPTYLGALGAFRTYGAKFIGVETDSDGMIIEDLENKLRENPDVCMVYVNPDFQNPTGIEWSVERRKAFAEVVGRYDVPALEDNPYGELCFEGEIPPSIKSFDEAGVVINLGSFSKILSPGIRVAWMIASPEILEKFMDMKQNDILCSSTFHQAQIVKYFERYDIEAHIKKICSVYVKRLDVLIDSINEYFPAGATVDRPSGGLFAWVTLPEGINARDVFKKAVEDQKVAFVPGGAFFAESGKENYMRLNFSVVPEEKIVEGVKRLSLVLKDVMS